MCLHYFSLVYFKEEYEFVITLSSFSRFKKYKKLSFFYRFDVVNCSKQVQTILILLYTSPQRPVKKCGGLFMSTQPIEVQILGRLFKFNCTNEQAVALQSAAADLNERLESLKQKTQINNTEQLLLSVALTLSTELAEEKIKGPAGEMLDRANYLCQQLDVILPN